MRAAVIGGTGFIGRFVVDELLRLGNEVAVVHRGSQPRELPGVTQIAARRERLADVAPQLRAFSPDVVVDMILSSGRQAEALLDVFRGDAGLSWPSAAWTSTARAAYSTAWSRARSNPCRSLNPPPSAPGSRPTRRPRSKCSSRSSAGSMGLRQDPRRARRPRRSEAAGNVLRLPIVYGPGDPLRRFYPVVKRIVDGRRVLLVSERVAHWRATRGYVEDVARAIALAATEPRATGRVYNVGEPDSLTELEWAAQIAHTMSWDGTFGIDWRSHSALQFQEEVMWRELGNLSFLSLNYEAQSYLLRTLRRFDEAITMLEQQKAICLELGDHDDLRRGSGTS